jgi:hypothetical protein
MANYDDGKAPHFHRYKWLKGPGGKSSEVLPGEGSFVASNPVHQAAVGTEKPVARGGGLHKAPGCVPDKNGV